MRTDDAKIRARDISIPSMIQTSDLRDGPRQNDSGGIQVLLVNKAGGVSDEKCHKFLPHTAIWYLAELENFQKASSINAPLPKSRYHS